ncbi:MAG: DUF2272 domain-containing protein [Fibrella sp.]|nr:DUF2272 domain-containing protein [Armatimonadota bacterium]
MPELPAPSEFAKKVATLAREQHDQFHLIDENDEPLLSQIEKYWQAVGQPFESVEVPWSAVFVSFCVKHAGATADEFEFAAAHSVFVHKAINDPAAFRGVKISAASVRVGDIIQNNRGGTSHNFEFAKTHPTYKSHSAVVVARGEDHRGKFALTIGGNESDSIRRVRVQLKDDGTIQQRATNPFMCLLKNEK